MLGVWLFLPAIIYAQETQISPQIALACEHIRALNLEPLQAQFEFLKKLSTDSCRTPPSPEDIRAIVDSLRPYVRTMQRNLTFYHWGTRGTRQYGFDGPKNGSLVANYDESIHLPAKTFLSRNAFLGPVPLNPEVENPQMKKKVDAASNYFISMTAHYFQSDHIKWMNGFGLYAAVDPMTSAEWSGGAAGFLLEIEVPAGERYLDLREPSRDEGVRLPRPKESDAAWERMALAEKKCIRSKDKSPNQELEFSLIDGYYQKDTKLRHILQSDYRRGVMQEVFRQLGIQFITAHWVEHSYSACRDRAVNSKKNTDVVFTDPGLQARAKFRILVNELERFPSPEKAAAYRRTLALLELADLNQSGSHGRFHSIDFFKNWYQKSWLVGILNSKIPADQGLGAEAFFGCSPDPAYAEEQRLGPPFP